MCVRCTLPLWVVAYRVGGGSVRCEKPAPCALGTQTIAPLRFWKISSCPADWRPVRVRAANQNKEPGPHGSLKRHAATASPPFGEREGGRVEADLPSPARVRCVRGVRSLPCCSRQHELINSSAFSYLGGGGRRVRVCGRRRFKSCTIHHDLSQSATQR